MLFPTEMFAFTTTTTTTTIVMMMIVMLSLPSLVMMMAVMGEGGTTLANAIDKSPPSSLPSSSPSLLPSSSPPLSPPPPSPFSNTNGIGQEVDDGNSDGEEASSPKLAHEVTRIVEKFGNCHERDQHKCLWYRMSVQTHAGDEKNKRSSKDFSFLPNSTPDSKYVKYKEEPAQDTTRSSPFPFGNGNSGTKSPAIMDDCLERHLANVSQTDPKFIKYLGKRFYMLVNARKYIRGMKGRMRSLLTLQNSQSHSLTDNEKLIAHLDSILLAHKRDRIESSRRNFKALIAQFLRDVNCVLDRMQKRQRSLQETLETWLRLSYSQKESLYKILLHAQRRDMRRLLQLRALKTLYIQKLHLMDVKTRKRLESIIIALRGREQRFQEALWARLDRLAQSADRWTRHEITYKKALLNLSKRQKLLLDFNLQRNREQKFLINFNINQGRKFDSFFKAVMKKKCCPTTTPKNNYSHNQSHSQSHSQSYSHNQSRVRRRLGKVNSRQYYFKKRVEEPLSFPNPNVMMNDAATSYNNNNNNNSNAEVSTNFASLESTNPPTLIPTCQPSSTFATNQQTMRISKVYNPCNCSRRTRRRRRMVRMKVGRRRREGASQMITKRKRAKGYSLARLRHNVAATLMDDGPSFSHNFSSKRTICRRRGGRRINNNQFNPKCRLLKRRMMMTYRKRITTPNQPFMMTMAGGRGEMTGTGGTIGITDGTTGITGATGITGGITAGTVPIIPDWNSQQSFYPPSY